MSIIVELPQRPAPPAPLPSRQRLRHQIGAASAPEPLLLVAFEGLSEAEQRAALAAFPGGRRFLLTR